MTSLENIDENKIIFDKQAIIEQSILAPGETNWFKVLTSWSFIVRFGLVVLIIIIRSVIILNTTLDTNTNSWFNKLHKPDWAPDGITVVIISAFLSILLAWVWYRLSENVKEEYYRYIINFIFVAILILQLVWTIVLYSVHNLVAAKILVCVLLGFAVLLFLFCAWYTRFSDVTLYTLLYVGWLVLVTFATFGLHELDKEYKILGIVKDKNSSLYKKKMKMEIVQGITITESGEKIEVAADEQE